MEGRRSSSRQRELRGLEATPWLAPPVRGRRTIDIYLRGGGKIWTSRPPFSKTKTNLEKPYGEKLPKRLLFTLIRLIVG